MILDFEQSGLPRDTTYDVCIVGAGAAGLTIAHQMLKSGHRILLLEGGGSSRWERKSQAINKSDISGEAFSGPHSGRFRGLGGTTTAWAGQVAELDELDFLDRAWVQGSSWPISKSELNKFYCQARELEGTTHLLHEDEKIWEHINGKAPPLGDDMFMSFSRYCPEKKFSRLFAGTTANPKLTVMLHANVVEMLPSKDKDEIKSLRIRTIEGKETLCSARQYILCLGGIESSRFLLNQSFEPWNESNLVGRHFQDHVHCFAADVRKAHVQSYNWPYGPFRLDSQYLPKLKITPAAQEKYGVLNVCGMLEYTDGMFETLRTGIKIVAGPITSVTPREFLRMVPRVPAVIWHHYKIKKSPNYVVPWAKLKLSVWCEQSPSSDSRISLSHKRDKLGLRKCNINWQISELELNSIRKYVSIVAKSFSENKIAEIIPDLELQTAKIREKCTDQFHHCGGTRMSVSPKTGVVNENLRLHNLKNAYLCSASVFPTSGFANPTHTVLALAIRLANHIDRQLAMPAFTL